MCGICGAVDWTGSHDSVGVVKRMTSTMSHRGPDDDGYFDDGPLAVGMRRLSIIDVEGGHQPIFNEDGSVGVILNGEIYNFRELRAQLEDRGHTFRTRSDSEVIAHAYEEWGEDCVEHLEGMFAFAVWDRWSGSLENQRKKSGYSRVDEHQTSTTGTFDLQPTVRHARRAEREGTLFLARDRLGIKPLYYYGGVCDSQTSHYINSNGSGENCSLIEDPQASTQNPQRQVFLFASEVRTLLASGVVPRRLSRAALDSYLFFGSVSEPMTLIDGVFSLPPGHAMTISLDGRRRTSRPKSYWKIVTSAPSNGPSLAKGRAGAVEGVRELLEASVRKHLVADVPVGVFLSGGIDSAALAGLASRNTRGVQTFTVTFPEIEFSEGHLSRQTARKFGTTHRELTLGAGELLTRLHEAVAALDQPSIDGINTYFVAWAARQAGLKVALSGLGADEIFGGYPTFSRTHRFQQIANWSNRFPADLRSAIAKTGEAVLRGDAGRKFVALWEQGDRLPHSYFLGRTLFAPQQVSELTRGRLRASEETPWWSWLREGVQETTGLDSFAAVTCMESRSYLVNTLLRDADCMSMAHSLELRVPFLDHPLVEFVTRLPASIKRRNGTPKALLVDAVGDLLPSNVVRQRKRGFVFPWASWLRGPLRSTVERDLSQISNVLRSALDCERISGIWQSYLNGDTSWSRPWSLYVLNEWTKRHLE